MAFPNRLPLACLALVMACACSAPNASPAQSTPAPAGSASPQFINMVDPWPYPFSSAVRAGNLLFVSGQIGSRVENGAPVLVPGGIEPEAHQALDNIKAVVEKGGASMTRVVKCTVMLADMKDWPKFNEIYATYFPGPKPARAAFGANGLALGARVEIDCIATVD